MHELSLAYELKRLIDGKRRNLPVQAVNIEVGALSGVVPQAFSFCAGTVLRDAFGDHVKINISYKTAEALCECGKKYPVEDFAKPCPSCGVYEREILSGRNVMLTSIVVEEE